MKKTIIITAAAFFTLGLAFLLIGKDSSPAIDAGGFLMIASAIIAAITIINK